jgi:hypothetical protein
MLYGAELAQPGATQVQAAEAVQNSAGRHILGTTRRTTTDIVRAELGWMPLEAQRHIAQLRFLHRLQSMPADSLVGHVFRHRMRTFLERQRRDERTHGFCALVNKTAVELGLGEHIRPDAVAGMQKWQWMRMVRAAVERREAAAWRERAAQAEAGSSMEFYRGVSDMWSDVDRAQRDEPLWQMETYLDRRHDGYLGAMATKHKARLRSSTAPLAAIQHRHYPERYPSPLCVWCDTASPEDQAHVLCQCEAHAATRQDLYRCIDDWHEWESRVVEWSEMSEQQQAQWLLSRNASRGPVVVWLRRHLNAVFRNRRGDQHQQQQQQQQQRTVATAAASASTWASAAHAARAA